MNKTLVGVLVAVVVAVGVVLLVQQAGPQGLAGSKGDKGETGLQGPRGLQGPQGPQGLRGRDGESKLGAVSGPELFSPYWTVDGVRTWFFSSPLNASGASTTVCSFKLPNATTTPIIVTGQITTASSTALQFEWGTSPLQAATTTSLGVSTIGSGVKATIVASTSQGAFAAADNIDPAYLLSPNNYLTFKFGGSAVGSALKGTCRAELREN